MSREDLWVEYLSFSLLLIASTTQAASPDEVATLKQVAVELGIPSNMWNFSTAEVSDPCEDRWTGVGCCSGKSTRCCNFPGDIYNNLPITLATCDFTSNATITVLMLRSDFISTILNGTLSGSSSLCNLTSLISLDVEFNNLKGQIPPCFGDMPLQVLRLGSNFINGTIPSEFGSGKLGSSLVDLHLDTLELTGEIPVSFGKFESVTSLILGNNQLQGRIPEELADVPKLHNLYLQGNDLTGEIPAFGDQMTEMVLFGNSLTGELDPMKFNRMTGCTKLDLRQNAFTGAIPDFDLPALVTLDLGFNNFTGGVPSFQALNKLNYLSLGHNSLDGELIPQQLPASAMFIDLSHNRLTMQRNQSTTSSFDKQVNYAFNRFNLMTFDNSGKLFFAVNAGGQNLVHGGLSYDNDTNTIGNVASSNNVTNSSVGMFYIPDRAWALELSGTAAGIYELQVPIQNVTEEQVQLYQSMRWSSSYMAYHGVGLKPGNYTVTLHFAELVFTEADYRVFDVLVAGVMVKQGLDVLKEAGGPRLAYKLITNTKLTGENSTLSVELISSGKDRSLPPNVYALDNVGPMISAISVVSQDYDFRKIGHSKKQSPAVVVAICIAAVLVAFLAAGGIYWRRKRKRILPPPPSLEISDSSMEAGTSFTYKQLYEATGGFSEKLGEGGFGAVYKGTLPNGVVIAVKQLLLKNSQNKRAEDDFRREIFILSKLRHKNLLSVLGHSISPNLLPMLVTEFMPNGALDNWLFFKRSKAAAAGRPLLTWEQRWKIAIGVANGLVYLHEESEYKIIHLDVKPANILLDSDMNPLIADFGLSRLFNDNDRDKSHITATRVQGTHGYLPPEYAMHYQLSDKVDVYSFGVVLLELLTGRQAVDLSSPTEQIMLVEWAQKEISVKALDSVDKRLRGQFDEQQVKDMAALAVLCTQRKASRRPKMQAVWLMLKGSLRISDFVARLVTGGDDENARSSDVTTAFATASSSSRDSHVRDKSSKEFSDTF